MAEDWLKPFRRSVHLSCGDSWHVVRSLKKIRLEVRTADGRQTTTLPYEWSESGAAAALSRIQQIAKRFGSGDAITLKAAAQGAETASSRQRINVMNWSISSARPAQPLVTSPGRTNICPLSSE